MDYVNRLDNFDGPAVGAIAVDAELFEEAFAIFKKFNLNVQAVNVLLDNIHNIVRAVEFASHVEEDEVWSQVRIAQGLVHMGKGLLTLNPYHSDRFLLSNYYSWEVPLCVVLPCYGHAASDATLDKNLKPLLVPVRVGQAVDVVGQAGRHKTIIGKQTHTTPFLLATGDRAELATEKYLPLSSVLEGFVILKPNPEMQRWRL
ncbi:unnamed protein product [Calypogeia fissa]